MGQRRQDHFARKAQAQGYPARSVFKLQALQEKFGLLKRGMRVLDLGAAPGSWTQYASGVVGNTPGSGLVVAVDLSPLGISGPGIHALQADFTAEGTVAELVALGPYDCVLSDAAPATTGNRIVDTARSEALVEVVLFFLPRWLRLGGNVAVKIFQGGQERVLLEQLRGAFAQAKAFRPSAVRSESFETYLVGLGYRGAGEAGGAGDAGAGAENAPGAQPADH